MIGNKTNVQAIGLKLLGGQSTGPFLICCEKRAWLVLSSEFESEILGMLCKGLN